MAKKSRTQPQPRVLKDLTYVARVTSGELGGEIPVALMPLSAKHRKQIGFVPGAIFRLTIGDAEMTGMVIETSDPSPLRKSELEKRRRKAKNFGTAQVVKSAVTFEILKQSRAQKFRFPDGDSQFRLKVIEKPTIGNSKTAVKSAAKTRKDAADVPMKVGKPGPFVSEVVELSLHEGIWIQSIVFDLGGKTMIGRVDINPPVEGVNIKGNPYKIGALVQAYVGEHRKGGVATTAPKEFKGWPGSVGRAFMYVAKHAKGGTMMLKLCELKRLSRTGKKLKNTKQAESAALAAWQEVMGIDA